MKSIKLLLVVCASFLVFAACGNGQNQNDKDKETVKATSETVSPDLAYWDLQGPVKRCDYVEFDREGKMVRLDNYDPFALEAPSRDYDTVTGMFSDLCQWTRDEQGRIFSITCYESYDEMTWNNGRVETVLSYYEGRLWKSVLEYDSNGHLAKQSEYNGDEDAEDDADLELFSTIEYTYLDFDNYGNWTRRNVKSIDAIIDYIDTVEETRNIEYYQ